MFGNLFSRVHDSIDVGVEIVLSVESVTKSLLWIQWRATSYIVWATSRVVKCGNCCADDDSEYASCELVPHQTPSTCGKSIHRNRQNSSISIPTREKRNPNSMTHLLSASHVLWVPIRPWWNFQLKIVQLRDLVVVWKRFEMLIRVFEFFKLRIHWNY